MLAKERKKMEKLIEKLCSMEKWSISNIEEVRFFQRNSQICGFINKGVDKIFTETFNFSKLMQNFLEINAKFSQNLQTLS